MEQLVAIFKTDAWAPFYSFLIAGLSASNDRLVVDRLALQSNGDDDSATESTSTLLVASV